MKWGMSVSLVAITGTIILLPCHVIKPLQVISHYNDVIMTTIAPQITSLAVVCSTVYSDADQRKHQSSTSLAFVWGIHRDRWIPRTKGQLRGKCFHLTTSSWISVSCNLLVPDLQVTYRDLITWQGTRLVVPVMATRGVRQHAWVIWFLIVFLITCQTCGTIVNYFWYKGHVLSFWCFHINSFNARPDLFCVNFLHVLVMMS